jgi:hypothetical protein
MSGQRANSVEVVIADPEKVIADHDLMGEKLHVTHSEAVHFGELSEAEKHLEKKLKKKIDSLIMPLVMLGQSDAPLYHVRAALLTVIQSTS